VRYWSDVDGCYIEAVVAWSGSMRTPLPGVGGIERRRAYLTEGAPASSKHSGELPTQAEMKGKTDLTGPQIRAGRPRLGELSPCRVGCGRTVTLADERSGHKRCSSCRRAGRGGRQAA